jgi:tricorn protease
MASCLRTFALLLTVALVNSVPLAAQTKLLRFPDVHGDQVVFTYGGDLWLASTSGGTATRLTADPGLELFARFSPDGSMIAFTGQYDGDEQVYVVPVTGGVPKQLTHYPARGPLTERWGYDNQVNGWTNDGKRVLFRSMRGGWDLGANRLFTVPVEGGNADPLPMLLAGSGSYAPDGHHLVYSPLFRDFRSEKRYGGGQANRLWIFDLTAKTAKPISEGPRAERDAMWIDGTIFYNTDKSGHFNIWAYDVATAARRQVTHSSTWDVRWPSRGDRGRIVYESAGELQLLDTRTGRATPISITVPTDGVASRPAQISAARQIEWFALSPKGERAVFAARGDIFTAPIENGPTRNLTRTSGAHDRDARWSPDGKEIAYISDQSGEEEIWVVRQDGGTKPEQLTSGSKRRIFAPAWAPDGKRLAFGDKDGKLFVLGRADRKAMEIADDPRGQILDYIWSPKGNFLAFTMRGLDGEASISVWGAADGRVRRVTGQPFNEYNPAWDPDGNYLFFLSDREYQPMISGFEFNYATTRTTGIFALALRKDVKHPFPPQSDEVVVAGDSAVKSDTTKALTIDFDGIETRVARVPVDADNIGGLAAKQGHLLYLVFGNPYYGRESDRKPALKLFAMTDRKVSTLSEDADGYELSSDGGKVLVSSGGSYQLMDATPTGASSKKSVSTAGLMVDRVPAEEWGQIFDEVWRRYRDYFYVKNMHGYDWEGLRSQYRPLLSYVAHRSDLNYVISEMVSELSVQHAYISGGDWLRKPRPAVALPGARFAIDSASGRYRIVEILPGQNEEPEYRSPLTEIGVDASAGDFVLKVDGEELTAATDIYQLLRNKANRPVALTLSRAARGDSGRTVSYRPITAEDDLAYLDWVTGNRRRVDQATGGRIGYLHIPDMGAAGIREFIKWFYPQLRKQGLIVDVRSNGGGNVSEMVLERLKRDLLATGYARTDDAASTYPGAVFVGPKVALLDEQSSSDGDIFPAMFKQARVGPLIGKRSWGGVVGITDHGQLIDGGSVNVPEFGFANAKGEWIIEGYGVDPDIEVENDPASIIAGKDPQLERAIAEVLKLVEKNPGLLPPKPADRVKPD